MDLVSPVGTLKLSRKTVHHSVVLSSVPRMSAELLTVETVDSATLTATVAVASSAVMVTVCVPGLGDTGRETEFCVVNNLGASVGRSRHFQSFRKECQRTIRHRLGCSRKYNSNIVYV